MMLLYIKQHLSNIWSPIHEKLSNTEAELKNTVAYKKKRVLNQLNHASIILDRLLQPFKNYLWEWEQNSTYNVV